MSLRFVASLLLVAACGVREAAAQPAIEVRSAFGASNYLHGDIGYVAPTVLVSLRAGRGPVAVEPEFAFAWHEETQRFGLDTTTVSSDKYYSVGVNLIGRTAGRVSGYGGGGAGVYWERDRYRLIDPVFGSEQSRTRGPRPGAQAVAGIDFTIASRVKAFGQFRYEVRSFDDPGGGSVVQGLAGVSIVLR